ncbi:hypothetical protein LOTGIDRAFT_165375 [Lottia gigantea]|uniref:Uncharacterized protein n=1 Tax=Lottia gigantea TaxID=225164 RepID=V3ZW40_LOTGI|nr:hypothetical protein LOTGIDRAFT_165375 [Lottia gigantea]ESO88592.1 hypothetical protein LOTGIDRAFT_165375 [Lottia gigantea]
MDTLEKIYQILGLLLVYVNSILSATTGTSAVSSSTDIAGTTPSSGGGGGGGDPADPNTSTTTETVYTDFFDDPHNQATYIVLPVIILVYGGCASIYCIDKCRKSCKKRARRKQQEQMMGSRAFLQQDEEIEQNTFENKAYDPDDHGRHNHIEEYKKNDIGNKLVYPEKSMTPTDPYELEAAHAKPMLQHGAQKMGYNIMPLPNSTEDPVVNSNIDTHLKNAFAMIEHAARDIKMQQALEMRSCPDRYPKQHENKTEIPNKGGYKKKYYIAT